MAIVRIPTGIIAREMTKISIFLLTFHVKSGHESYISAVRYLFFRSIYIVVVCGQRISSQSYPVLQVMSYSQIMDRDGNRDTR